MVHPITVSGCRTGTTSSAPGRQGPALPRWGASGPAVAAHRLRGPYCSASGERTPHFLRSAYVRMRLLVGAMTRSHDPGASSENGNCRTKRVGRAIWPPRLRPATGETDHVCARRPPFAGAAPGGSVFAFSGPACLLCHLLSGRRWHAASPHIAVPRHLSGETPWGQGAPGFRCAPSGSRRAGT